MTILLAFLFMLIIVAAMSVGVMFGRKPIAGSCGGLKTLGIDGDCEVCGGNPAACDSKGPGRRADAGELEALASDASQPRRRSRTL